MLRKTNDDKRIFFINIYPERVKHGTSIYKESINWLH